eukprot:Cvel_15889.t1-p1 / transcript=Cvel_15889.t1 / gene=Cvel_15889 / organism=Chromera_velia_CCMP2878 / gene_product=hypothetical protein / transcript_product=hypothetical protein / location=Cvel_scaffold1200:2937-5446(-) / protein_length=59 / sequence_SO=supercontig / SO=protein_coding / is_pseudo=false
MEAINFGHVGWHEDREPNERRFGVLKTVVKSVRRSWKKRSPPVHKRAARLRYTGPHKKP